MRRQHARTLLVAGGVALGGCGVADGAMDEATVEVIVQVVLGPTDGHELPPTDIDRVLAGQMAPDFSAASLAGEVVTLSQFRGTKNVVLFFYRGHW